MNAQHIVNHTANSAINTGSINANQTSGPIGVFANNSNVLQGSQSSLAFVQTLQQAMVQSGIASESLPANHQLLLQQLGQGLVDVDNAKLNMEGLTLEEISTLLTNWLTAHPEATEQSLEQHPELIAWYQQTADLLNASNQGTEVSHANETAKPVFNVATHTEMTNLRFQDLQKLMSQVVVSLQSQPDQTQLQALADQLKGLLQKALTSDGNHLNATKASSLQNSQIQAIVSQGMTSDQSKFVRARQTNTVSMVVTHEDSLLMASSHKRSALEMLHNKAAVTPVIYALTQSGESSSSEVELKQNQTLTTEFTNAVQQELAKAAGESQPLKAAPQPVQANQFAREVADMFMQNLKIKQMLNGVTEAKISLMPEHLGQVDIKITMQNGQMVAQFMTESILGKEMIDSQLSQLRATLQNQGIQVDKLEVTHHSDAQTAMFQNQKQGQQSFGQSGQQKQNASQDVELTLEDLMEEFVQDDAFQSARLHKGSFHATA